MKTSLFTSIITVILILFSCIKHEIIPAPIPKVELKSKFRGYIDGSATLTEFNEGVNGYTCVTNNDVFLQTTAVYYSSISSTTNATTSPSIRLGLGTLSWSGAATPTVDQFNAFFAAYVLPPYRTGASNGLEIQYTTALGAIYTSRQTTTAYQDAVFSNIIQESDDTGDYSKFVCNFNCYVYWTAGTLPEVNKDSLKIQSGVFKGWFKK